MIDFNFDTNDPLKAGSVLVSEPFLADDYFTRSVIFLCDHNKDGSFGFVLNKYIDQKLSEFIKDFPEIGSRISVGGPVDTSTVFYIHALGDEIPNSVPCGNELSIGGDFKSLTAVLREDPEKSKKVRFFIGYSGWGKDQLKEELEKKSWIVLNSVTTEQIMDTSREDIWKKILEELGGKFKVMSKFPVNPSDN